MQEIMIHGSEYTGVRTLDISYFICLLFCSFYYFFFSCRGSYLGLWAGPVPPICRTWPNCHKWPFWPYLTIYGHLTNTSVLWVCSESALSGSVALPPHHEFGSDIFSISIHQLGVMNIQSLLYDTGLVEKHNVHGPPYGPVSSTVLMEGWKNRTERWW